MKLLSVALAGCLALGASSALADEKGSGANAEKIVGTWEVTKGESLKPGTTLELTKDGKFKLTIKAGDKAINLAGTYKVEGDNLTVKLAAGQQSTETMQIKKLTDSELVTVDKQKKTDTFKKK
jgi:uncharacterized protein (TIGR03066 family)